MSTVNDWASSGTADVTKPSDPYIQRGFVDFEPLPAAFMNWVLNELTNKALFPEQNPGWVVSGDIAAASGFIVENTPANLQVTVKGGVIEVGGFRDTYAETVLTSDANDPTLTQDRYDLVIARNGAYEIVKGATMPFPATSPPIPSDAIGIAELYVPGGVTGFVAGGSDLRYKAPWRAASIAPTPTRLKLSGVAIAPASSASGNSEITLTVQVKDANGIDLARQVRIIIETFLVADGSFVPNASFLTNLKYTVTAGTTQLSAPPAAGGERAVLDTTSGGGLATVTLDAGAGSNAAVFIKVTPVHFSGGTSSGGIEENSSNYLEFLGGPTMLSTAFIL